MVAALTAVQGAADGPDAATRHAKLTHAAQQFEAVMLGELMKPLGKSSGVVSGDEEQSGNAMQGYGVEAMAGALARSGALGFAHRIVAAVEGHAAKSFSGKDQDVAHVSAGLDDKPIGGNSR